MSKSTIAIISTDKHLNQNNVDSIIDLSNQEIDLCLKNNCFEVIWLGDIFDSRSSQRQDLLCCLSSILEKYHENDIRVTCVVGNHDKTDYTSQKSFLTPFKYHPGFRLIEQPTLFEIGSFDFVAIPFFETETWLNHWNQWTKERKVKTNKTILLSHIAVQGSVNNDGSMVESSIKPSLFKDYFKVFLGHYHNAQQIASNIFHLPSNKQNNFGEDDQKGFTLLYEDGRHDLVCAKFKRYKTVSIDVDTVTKKDLNKLISTNENSEDEVRFELKGKASTLEAFKPSVFAEKGITVIKKAAEVEDREVSYKDEIETLSHQNISEKFDQFCEERKYDVSIGKVYLNQIIQK